MADISEDKVGDAQIVLLEGYVWDIPEGPALAARAIDIAKRNNARVALSLSDSFCVERHQQAYFDAVRDGVDIVFADEDEILALFGEVKFENVSAKLQALGNLFVVTRSAKGSVIFHGEEVVVQEAMNVEKVIDTTGAGDAYTAAFLYGMGQGKSLAECARLGTWCGGNVIQQVGGRIEKDMLDGYTSVD